MSVSRHRQSGADYNHCKLTTKELRKRLTDEAISGEIIDDIENMGRYAAWHWANTYKNYASDAERDEKTFTDHANSVLNSGLFGADLAWDMRWCAWNLSRYHAKRIFGHFAENDLSQA